MVWYGLVSYGMVWYGMVWYGMVWYGMVWYGMVWHGMVWYDIAWYRIIAYIPEAAVGRLLSALILGVPSKSIFFVCVSFCYEGLYKGTHKTSWRC